MRSAFPGNHPGAHRGSGSEFSHHAGLLDAPDPRRYDLRASIKDPLQRALVRVHRQPGSVAVQVLADLSASMGFQGERRKLDVVADFVECIGNSAYRTGDAFGFVGAGDVVLGEFLTPPSRRRVVGGELASRLRAFRPTATSADGLTHAADLLGGRRSLVFAVSDFHWPLARVQALLVSLGRHQVVPVVLWDRAEYQQLPRFGMARVVDAETGRQQSLLLRPLLAARIRQRFEQRREQLQAVFNRNSVRPLWLLQGMDADAFTGYFFGDS